MSTFEESFRGFLEAVQKRDYEKFLKYLSPAAQVTAVLPDGKTYNSYPEFLRSQESWFRENRGTFEYVILQTRETPELGFATIQATLRLPLAIENKIYISFLFEREQDRWIMVHDQNTLLR